MKKVSLLFVCFALACTGADAQSLLERLGERAKNAAENNVGNKVEQGVNDLLNGKLGKKKDKKNQKQETPAQTAYAKSDFVPGDEVIYDDPMDDEQLGEFPSRLELLAGESEVLEINGKKCFAMSHHGDRVSPLMKNPRNFLGDVFTVEFDAFQTGEEEGRLEWEFFPADMDKDPVFHLEIPVSDDADNYSHIWYWKAASGEQEGSRPVTLTSGKWHHLAISFNKRALKYYLDGERIINIPNVAMAPGWFALGSVFEPKLSITNLRICKGAVPLYDRLASDGKIVTYAITFDTGKATLKPEADVEINRIKGIMDQDASLKFEVQGHCDNTGSDKVNDPLSQKRAEAIVARLVELGIAKDRLTAVGKGSHEPIADNSSDEGRAKNRRVEFVKK